MKLSTELLNEIKTETKKSSGLVREDAINLIKNYLSKANNKDLSDVLNTLFGKQLHMNLFITDESDNYTNVVDTYFKIERYIRNK